MGERHQAVAVNGSEKGEGRKRRRYTRLDDHRDIHATFFPPFWYNESMWNGCELSVLLWYRLYRGSTPRGMLLCWVGPLVRIIVLTEWFKA